VLYIYICFIFIYIYSSGHSFGSFLVWSNWDMFGSSESSHNPQPEWRSSTDGISIKQMAHSTATPRHCDKPGLVRTSTGHLSTPSTLLKFIEHHRTAETASRSKLWGSSKVPKLEWRQTNCQVQVSNYGPWKSSETEISNQPTNCALPPPRLQPTRSAGCEAHLQNRGLTQHRAWSRPCKRHSSNPGAALAPKGQSSNEPVRCIVVHYYNIYILYIYVAYNWKVSRHCCCS
jgi:hypothetical protein